MSKPELTINDVTGLNPTAVWGVARPARIAELREVLL